MAEIQAENELPSEGPRPVLLDLLIGFITATAERLVPRKKEKREKKGDK